MPLPPEGGKIERKVQKWQGWWAEKEDQRNASKHYETYRKHMERLGQPVSPMPTAPSGTSGSSSKDRHDGERRSGKKHD